MSGIVNPFLRVPVELEKNTSWYTRTTSGNTITSDARPIGVASATRRVFALIGAIVPGVGPEGTLDSVTIGGVAATIHGNTGDPGDVLYALASAVVPTGTTAIVVANYSVTSGGSMGAAMIGCVALDHPSGLTVHDTLSAFNANPVSGTIDFPPGGYGIFVSGQASYTVNGEIPPDPTWVGATRYFNSYASVGSDEGNFTYSLPMSAGVVRKHDELNETVQVTWANNRDNGLLGVTVGVS